MPARAAPNARCAAQYQGRLSGPLLDRFDLTIDVPAVTAADLLRPAPAEGSAEVAARVAAARAIQLERYRELGLDDVGCNAAAPASVVEADGRARRFRGRLCCARRPSACALPRAATIAC